MALRITELFGFEVEDRSPAAESARAGLRCPFVPGPCTKTLSDGTTSGVCTVAQSNDVPVVCCPKRLYANSYQILRRISESAFGSGLPLLPAQELGQFEGDRKVIAVFGKGWGKELRLPKRRGSGNYFVDWILARVSRRVLEEFVAVEVQTIDTTGNYRAQRAALLRGETGHAASRAGLNWENVSKRILPQIIYKGHVLRREPLCQKGLFLVCPAPVYSRIRDRLGGTLLEYAPQPGALTFHWYELGAASEPGSTRALRFAGEITTTVDQVANAFTAPASLPPSRVYEAAIQAGLEPGNG